MGGVRVGAAGATPTDGGTVILENSVIGTQAQAVQLNTGTLSAASNLVFSNGLSIGGRTNGAAVLAGSNMEFQGQAAFFRGTGTSGELVLNVNNATTFSGGFGATSGSGGTATGITIGGNGEMIISGSSSALVDTITLTDTVKLTLNSTLGGSLIVGGSNVLAGNGTVTGNLSFLSGGKFELNLDSPLTISGGSSVSFTDFGIDDIAGLSSSTAVGTYSLFSGTVNTNNLANIGAGNAFDLGSGKSAYFSIGSLEVNVVPEPSTYALLVLSAAGLGAHVIRRRRR
jgi:PEP-CTERM motif